MAMDAWQQRVELLMPGLPQYTTRIHRGRPPNSFCFDCLVRRSRMLFFTSVFLLGSSFFSHVLAQKSVGERGFGATGTPMAILVDAEGRIASELAAGAPAVLAVARRSQEETARPR